MKTQENLGFEYTLALCRAISELTKTEEALDKSIFYYKNLNLRYALERSLYSSYAENDLLYNVFTQWKSDTLPEEIVVEDLVQKKLICLLCDLPEERIVYSPPKKIKKYLKPIVRFVLNLGLESLVTKIRRYINDINQKNKNYEVLFFVLNERFIKYMRPIFAAMPAKTAYLTHDVLAEKYLEKEKIPLLKISHFLYLLTRWSKPDSWVKQFCLTDHYDILFDTISKVRPKSIVLVEGGAATYEVVNQICKQLNIQTVCIQQGWSPIIHSGFQNMTYSKMLVWGEGFKNDLERYNPKENFITTGSFAIKKTSRKPSSKIKIGFLPPMRTIILSQEKLEEFMTLIPWAAQTFPESEIRVSLHPTIASTAIVEKLSPYKNVTFLSSRTHTLEEIIAGNDLAISFYSTTILESLAAGALPIIVNLTAMPHYYPDVDAAKAGVEVRSIEKAKEIIKEFIDHPEKISEFESTMNHFKEKYFAYNKKQAMQNIIKEII